MLEQWGVEILAFPLTWQIAYTTACCYRTSRDYMHMYTDLFDCFQCFDLGIQQSAATAVCLPYLAVFAFYSPGFLFVVCVLARVCHSDKIKPICLLLTASPATKTSTQTAGRK